MSTRDNGERAVRLRHYQGERLHAQDLQDEYDNLTWLRGLHVVALHNTWGIALGYAVQLGPNGVCLVGPGLAYDAERNEILLAETRTVPGPQLFSPGTAIDGAYELIIRYDAGLGEHTTAPETAPGRTGPCAPRREEPAFAWRRRGETRLGTEIPLLGLRIVDRQIDVLSLDYSVRRYAQPLVRPHIGGGVTPREQLFGFWALGEFWIGYQTTVDTSAAGFVGTPYYMATLHFNIEELPGAPNDFLLNNAGFFFPSVSNPTPTSFNFQFVFANQTPWITMRMAAAETDRTPPPLFQVSWVGIEPVSGCAPAPYFDFVIQFLERVRSPLIFDDLNRVGGGG